MKSVIVLLSGGLDSTVLLYKLKADGYRVQALSADYGQRHRKELDYAKEICEYTHTKHYIADLNAVKFCLLGGSQTDLSVPVPKGHYADESMKATVVPNRNMIMLSLATGLAISTKADAVAYAAHAGDHAVYPDCRPEFMTAMHTAMRLADYSPIQLLAPFATITKADIVKMGSWLNVPFEKTWSCYSGRELHDGTCGTCFERHEAFELAGVTDPTVYEKETV